MFDRKLPYDGGFLFCFVTFTKVTQKHFRQTSYQKCIAPYGVSIAKICLMKNNFLIVLNITFLQF